jgi:hypothetical protein
MHATGHESFHEVCMGLRDDPLYIGLDQDRLNGDEYYEVYHLSLCNAIAAVKAVSPILRLC